MSGSLMVRGRCLLRVLAASSYIGTTFILRNPCIVPCRFFAANKIPDSEKRMTSRLTGKKTPLWSLYNEVVYPPRDDSFTVMPSEEISEKRPAEVTYTKDNILYSQKKLWFLSYMIRGLSVDEAFQHLGFRPEKGARIIEKALEAAIELAMTEHDVEFCTNLWVEQALVLRGEGVPRIHKGLRTNVSLDNYHYARLHLRLREGSPPALYHPLALRSSWHPAPNCPADGAPGWGSAADLLDMHIRKLRRRRIPGEL